MIGYFSRRRAAIEKRYGQLVRDYRDRHGHDPSAGAAHELARQANLDTRQGKKPPRSLASKRAAWRAELDEHFGPGAAARLMTAIPDRTPQAAPEPPAAPLDVNHFAERSVANVAARRSVWTPWNIRAEAERLLRAESPALPPEKHRQTVDAITTLAVSPKYSVSVDAPALLDEPPELRREDGEPVFAEHGSARFTSPAILDAEQRLLNATRTPTVHGLSGPSVAASLDGFEAITGTRLDDGQRHLVTAFAFDERLLLAGLGPAGSGKTTAMRAYAHVVRQHGRKLVPLATSAAAADVLGRELGVDTENVHKFIHEWTVGPFAARLRAGASAPSPARPFALRPGDVVLVDEAGMAGTLLLDRLVQIAASKGAIVRLLGDHRQLPAVESGGALRLIASQPGTPELTVLYRFRDPAEASATLRLRTGDGTAVDWYEGNGRLRAGSRDHMIQAVYTGWKADMLAGKVSLMAAPSNADVTQLSAQARADRVQVGQVDPDGTELHDGNVAGRGDWIVTRHNDRRMSTCGGRDWLKNGDAWHVERRHGDGSLTVRAMAHGGRVRLPAHYVAEHVELLYATTAHRAQGSTVDTAHPLITAGMTRESLYVLASRARERTTFYVATHDLPFDEDDRVDRVRTSPYAYAAREILLNILATEATTLSATETITAAQEEAGSLATLVPRYQHAARQQAEHRYTDTVVRALGDQAGADLQADPAWPQVVLCLHEAESNGWNPARLLAAVAAQRDLATADSLAEVLAWRLDGYLADNEAPPRKDQPYESAATARERLAEVARTTLGRERADLAQAEVAWPALITALRRAEAADFDAAELLSHLASLHALRATGSTSEALAIWINRYLATHPDPESVASRPQVPLPWMAPAPAGASSAVAQYLNDATDLITSRVAELADTAIRHRPPWMQPLGQPATDPEHKRQWLAHVAIIAAYREQFKVTTDDPSHILGPHAEPDTPARKPYWHAAESVLAARRLAGLDAPSSANSPEPEVRAQAANDIYRAPPEKERAEISTEMARKLGPLWFGSPTTPDEDAASRRVHATTLASTLARHGYLTADALRAPEPSAPGDLIKARAARRTLIRDSHRGGNSVPAQSGPTGASLQVPRSQDAAARQGPQPRVV
jgi:hypothetical protein